MPQGLSYSDLLANPGQVTDQVFGTMARDLKAQKQGVKPRAQKEALVSQMNQLARDGKWDEIDAVLNLHRYDTGSGLFNETEWYNLRKQYDNKKAISIQEQQEMKREEAQEQAANAMQQQEMMRQQMAQMAASQGYPQGSPGFSSFLGAQGTPGIPGTQQPGEDISSLLRMLA